MIRVNDNEIEWHEGMTVADALEAMGYEFASIAVSINGVMVPPGEHDTQLIPDGADVRAIHLHQGG